MFGTTGECYITSAWSQSYDEYEYSTLIILVGVCFMGYGYAFIMILFQIGICIVKFKGRGMKLYWRISILILSRVGETRLDQPMELGSIFYQFCSIKAKIG